MTLQNRHITFGLFSVVLIAFAFQPIRELIAFALDLGNKHLSHIVLIPFISATLIFQSRKAIFAVVRTSVYPGVALMVIGAIFLVAGRAYAAQITKNDYLSLMTTGVLAIWLGGFLVIYGEPAFKAGLFPLLFLGFCIPMPTAFLDRVTWVLQTGSSDMLGALLKLSGTPVFREGFFFSFPGLTIEVAKECSSIRSTIAFFIAGILAAHLFLRTGWKRIVLLIALIPISVLKNALRIASLSLLAVHIDKRILTSKLHEEGGIPFLIIGFIMLYPILALLVRSERQKIQPVPQLSIPNSHATTGTGTAFLPTDEN